MYCRINDTGRRLERDPQVAEGSCSRIHGRTMRTGAAFGPHARAVPVASQALPSELFSGRSLLLVSVRRITALRQGLTMPAQTNRRRPNVSALPLAADIRPQDHRATLRIDRSQARIAFRSAIASAV
jgi:hypothetical protein